MNTIKLIKDWTLPVSMCTGTLLYLLFAFTPSLDGAATFFAPIFDAILPLFMFLILFVTFCKVDFRKLRPVGWHLWIGVFQVLFVAIVMGIILILQLRGDHLVLLEAILCCIIGPTAAAAAVVTQKLGGSLEQMTTYTFISNFITVALIPICFPMIEKGHDISFTAAFLKILREVVLVLLVPMLLAYIVKHHLHRLHRWVISLCCIALLGLVLCIVQFAVGRFVGHYFNRTVESGQALGQKNTAFAIWMAYTYLNPLSSVGPGCYILWQNIINSIEIWQQRKSEKPNAASVP